MAPETVPEGEPPRTAETGVRLREPPGRAVLRVVREGREVEVACSTCHGSRAPDADATRGAPEGVHAGLALRHGALRCVACHAADDYDALRLADGRALPFERAPELCAQCHGTQARDHADGLHGGMSGYWDTRRGVQVRNQCTHCHDPHTPAFPLMRPTFKPRDRFLDATAQETGDE